MTSSLFVKMALDAWFQKIKDTETLFDKLTDEQLTHEASPGRNTGVYLLGHLTAVHDRMVPLLGFGEQSYPDMNEVFLSKPDKSGLQMPSIPELRERWKKANATLAEHFKNISDEGWFERHTSVSPEAFEKEPHRNRLNVLISRTNHISYHHGQIIYLG